MNKRQYKKRYIYVIYDPETCAFYKTNYHHIRDIKPKSPKEQRLFNREWVTNEGGKGRKGKKKTKPHFRQWNSDWLQKWLDEEQERNGI